MVGVALGIGRLLSRMYGEFGEFVAGMAFELLTGIREYRFPRHIWLEHRPRNIIPRIKVYALLERFGPASAHFFR